MIALLLIYIYLFVVSYVLGQTLLRWLYSLHSPIPVYTPRLPLVLLTGFALTGTIANYLSLFIRLNWEAMLLLALICVAATYFQPGCWLPLKRYFQFYNWQSWGILLLSVFIVCIQSTPSPNPEGLTFYDERLYYIPTVRWTTQYPVVPGLGNLSVAYSYNSSWFQLAALVSLEWTGWVGFNDLSGFLYLLLVIFCLDYLRPGNAFVNQLGSLFMLVYSYFFIRLTLVSLSADLALGIWMWVILMLWTEKIHQPEHNTLPEKQVLLLLLSFSFTIKPSAWAYTPLAFFLFLSFERKWKVWASGLLLMSVVIVPYLIRNVISSGYLLNPLTLIDWFDMDWKIVYDNKEVKPLDWYYLFKPFKEGISHRETGQFRFYTHPGNLSVWEVYSSIFREGMRGNIYARLQNISFFIFLPIQFFFNIFLLRKNRSGYLKAYIFIQIFILLFWLFILPSWHASNFRPILSFIYFTITYTPALILASWLNSRRIQVVSGFFWLLLLLQCKQMLNIESKDSYFRNYFLFPAPYPVPPTREVRVKNGIVQVPLDKQLCWGADLPCVPEFALHPCLELRGKTLKDGFRTNCRKK
jgi:hypothetical protein